LKREIVRASAVPGASVSEVARRYAANTNLVFTWRKRFSEASAVAPAVAPAPQLVPVVAAADALPPSGGMIEIELPRGYRIRVGGHIAVAMLGLVLDALERR